MNIILTGDQGVGKTRLVKEVLDELEADAGGITVKKEEEDGEISELRLKDLGSGEEQLLASHDMDSGPHAYGFTIDVDTINEMSKEAIDDAIRKGRLIVIDMINRIEMHSSLFRESVRDAFRGSEDVIAVVDTEYVDEFEDEGRVIELRTDNYDAVKAEILDLLRAEKEDDT